MEQATDKFYTVLERGQIGDEDATIKNAFCNDLISNYSINLLNNWLKFKFFVYTYNSIKLYVFEKLGGGTWRNKQYFCLNVINYLINWLIWYFFINWFLSFST